MMSTDTADRISPQDWLNAAFVESVLRDGEADSTVRVVSLDIHLAHAEFDGFGSDMFRVRATLENKEHRSLIVKCRVQEETGRELTERLGLFIKETRLLATTLPAMNTLLKKCCPEEFQPLGAKCLYHGCEPLPFIVMEDLRELGFTLVGRKRGLDYAHCRLVLHTLARFHASSIALHQQHPEELQCFYENHYREEFRDVFEEYNIRGVRALADEVKKWPGFEKYSERLLELKDSVYSRLTELTRWKEGALNTLVHADPWAANMMFRYSEDVVRDLRLLDFQGVFLGSPIIDVLHFIYANATVEIQLNKTGELMREYHTALCQTLNLLGCHAFSLSWDDFLRLCDEYKFYAFYVSTTIYPLVVYDPDEVAHGGDTDRSPLSTNRPFKGELYKQVMQHFLPLYEQQGIL